MVAAMISPAACDKSTPPPTAPEDALETSSNPEPRVVPNLEAQPGDTTTCPYSGRAFVVKTEHPKVEYEGKHYWLCSEEAAQKVRANPKQYLEGFER